MAKIIQSKPGKRDNDGKGKKGKGINSLLKTTSTDTPSFWGPAKLVKTTAKSKKPQRVFKPHSTKDEVNVEGLENIQ